MLVGIYFAIVWAISHWLTAWHDWDWEVFDRLKPAPTALPSQIVLVDLEYNDKAEVPQHRQVLSSFLNLAAAQHPTAIILDIPFGRCQATPCSAAMDTSRTSLIRAVDRAESVRTNGVGKVGVFANVGDIALDSEALPGGTAPDLDPVIYSHFTAYGHTATKFVHESNDSGDLYYYPCYAAYPPLFDGRMVADVWALVDVALHRDANSVAQTCDQDVRVAVRYGPVIPERAPNRYHISASAPFPRKADFYGKYVIVGVPAFDRNDRISSRSGPEILAWIVDDELASGQLGHTTIAAPGKALVFIVPFFSAVVVLAFVACFLFLKRLPLGATRPFLPLVSALLATCIGFSAFIAFEVWYLLGLHQIQPQVALVSLAMAVAGTLCGVRGWQIERDTIDAIDDTAPPESYDYDVFLSYAHKELDWVDENVYRPLRKAGLNVFFDRSSIRIGTAWQDRIALSIRYSRFVVAIYSEAYFSRPYCRYEIKRAHRKWVNAGEESRCVFPIMRGHVQIPEAVDDIQARSIDDDPDLVEHVIADIVARLKGPAVKPHVGAPS